MAKRCLRDFMYVQSMGVRMNGDWFWHPALYGRNHPVQVDVVDDYSRVVVTHFWTGDFICIAELLNTKGALCQS